MASYKGTLAGACGFLTLAFDRLFTRWTDTTWASEGFVDGSLGRGSLCLCRHCGVDQVGSCEYSEDPGGFSKHDHYDAIACPQASTGDDLLPLMSRPP